jgi:hypothetical protein
MIVTMLNVEKYSPKDVNCVANTETSGYKKSLRFMRRLTARFPRRQLQHKSVCRICLYEFDAINTEKERGNLLHMWTSKS